MIDIPRGREPASDFVANGQATVLSGLRFDDVLPRDAVEPGEARTWQVRYAMFDGLVIDATAWEVEGKDYARFTARLDDQVAVQHVETAQQAAVAAFEQARAEVEAANKAALEADPKAAQVAPPEAPLAVSDAAADREQRLAALRKEAEDLEARFKGWTYVIPAFKFANMNKTSEDMLKPVAGK
jgi:hypothetical protein